MLDSLVRVSRRVAWNHYASVLGRTADLGPTTPHDAKGYNAPQEVPHPRGLSPAGRADAGPTSMRRILEESGCLGMQLKMGGKFHLKLNIGERPIANK